MEQPRKMDRAVIESLTLEYEPRGKGEPIVLIHPGHFADWLTPPAESASAVRRISDASLPPGRLRWQ
jgi:hypothetical protein